MLSKLDLATDRAAKYAISTGYPIRISKKSTVIGNAIVAKRADSFYNVMSLTKNVLYKSILTFDVAVILAQRYNSGETGK